MKVKDKSDREWGLVTQTNIQESPLYGTVLCMVENSILLHITEPEAFNMFLLDDLMKWLESK